MYIEHGRRGIQFDTDVEEWMGDLCFTEVFNFSVAPLSDAEKEVTRTLDQILYEVIYGTRLDDVIALVRNKKLIQGRKMKPGEQLLNTAMGNAVDSVFKSVVEREISSGALRQYGSRLTVTPGGVKGPDVYMQGSPMTAWDVTTRQAARDHVVRDNFRRGWNRYYLLIWDEPGTGFRVGGKVRRLSRLL